VKYVRINGKKKPLLGDRERLMCSLEYMKILGKMQEPKDIVAIHRL